MKKRAYLYTIKQQQPLKQF